MRRVVSVRQRRFSSRFIVPLTLSAFAAAIVALYFTVLQSECNGGLISRKLCFYLKAPLVWVTPERVIAAPPPTVISPAAVPSGVDPHSIRGIAADEIALYREQVAGGPGGFIGISGTREEESAEGRNLYVTDSAEPFVGVLELGIFNFPAPLPLAITCLLDFVQTACEPSSETVQQISLASDQILQVPITLMALEDGLHDIVVVAWQDLSPEAGQDDPRRDIAWQKAIRASIASGGETSPQRIEYLPLPLPMHVLGLEGFVVSNKRDPWDRYGGFRAETYLQARPGEELNVFLHLFNQQAFRVEYAIAAFIDYQQTPIAYRGGTYATLFFSTKANAWYAIPIRLKAPLEPGLHELVLLGEHFPEARMDLESTLYRDARTLSLDLFSSARILLEVVDSSN